MRIALVNDLVIALAGLRQVVQSIDGATVAWTAKDGAEALQRCHADRPDLILMDMIMPVMDGVESTRRIMQECPCAIVVVTATVEGNAGRVFEALGHGALDAVNTPVLGTGGDMSGAEALVHKIHRVRQLTAPRSAAVAPRPPSGSRRTNTPQTGLIAIGASTGGPAALASVLRALPTALPCPVLLVQHLELSFADGLATWLGQESGLDVRTVTPGQPLVPAVFLAATTDHMVLAADGTLRYTAEPKSLVYRPSVDVLFQSLVDARPYTGTAVLLTGMGHDGAAGLLALREGGWHTIAQDEATSVVWGMPGAAVQRGAACQVLALPDIGPALAGRCAARSARGDAP